MTRINVGYPVKKLTTRHLLSEAREIKRIPNMVRSGKMKPNNIPEQFTLGTGHVKFFANKLGYLKNRYIELYNECKGRGFNVQNYISAWDNIPQELMNDYIPTKRDIKIIEQRINEKLGVV